MTTETTSTSTKFLKVAPKEIPQGMQLVSFSRKSTAKNPVAEEHKERHAIVPAYPKVDASIEGSSNAVLTAALLEVIEKQASSVLQAAFIANPEAEEVDASILEWSAILASMEEKQSKETITGDIIAQWYDSSETGKANATRYGTDDTAKKKSAMLRQKYMSLASMNSGIPAEQATRFLGYLKEEDLSHPIAATVARRLSQIIAKAVDSNDL